LIRYIKEGDSLENIAILAYTNEMVMDIYSLLQENNINARYLIEREKFELKNIVELVEFDAILNSYLQEDEGSFKDNYFEQALKVIESKYKDSLNLELVGKIVDKFLNESDHYYISQWISYLEEIKLEEFENHKKNIVVSTIHKSKGMEFDRVYLLVDKNPKFDEEKRLFYVGMTRAKNELHILRQGGDVPNKKEYVKYFLDEYPYENETKTYTHIMSLQDINLGFDLEKYGKNESFFAGTFVQLEKREKFKNLCLIQNNKILGVLSESFQALLDGKINKNFIIESCVIEYVVIWEDKKINKFFKHPLCKVLMKKRG
jgi:ATP-dependent DNA helicase RecQ